MQIKPLMVQPEWQGKGTFISESVGIPGFWLNNSSEHACTSPITPSPSQIYILQGNLYTLTLCGSVWISSGLNGFPLSPKKHADRGIGYCKLKLGVNEHLGVCVTAFYPAFLQEERLCLTRIYGDCRYMNAFPHSVILSMTCFPFKFVCQYIQYE